jgi:hypothetical protein
VILVPLLPGLRDALFQNRTQYVAVCKDKIIQGCGDCGNNQPFPGFLPFAPTHRCIISTDDDGKMNVIYDPFNVPEFCPIKQKKE